MGLRRLHEGTACPRFGRDGTDASDEPVTVSPVTSNPRRADVTAEVVTRLERENAALRLQVAKLTAELIEARSMPAAQPRQTEAERKAKTAARVAAHRRRKAGS